MMVMVRSMLMVMRLMPLMSLLVRVTSTVYATLPNLICFHGALPLLNHEYRSQIANLR